MTYSGISGLQFGNPGRLWNWRSLRSNEYGLFFLPLDFPYEVSLAQTHGPPTSMSKIQGLFSEYQFVPNQGYNLFYREINEDQMWVLCNTMDHVMKAWQDRTPVVHKRLCPGKM